MTHASHPFRTPDTRTAGTIARTLVLLPALAIALAASPADAKTPRPPIERLPAVGTNPFAAGVRAGDMFYISGQIGTAPDGTLPPGMEAQARNALDRITAVLKSVGLGWKDVTRCLVMLKDIKDWPAFNEVYAGYVLKDHLPARSAFAASGLVRDAAMELQCDAYMPAK